MRPMALKGQLPLIFSSWVVLVTIPRGKLFCKVLLWLLSLFTEEELTVLLCTRQK